MQKEPTIKTLIWSISLIAGIIVSLNFDIIWVWILVPIAIIAYYKLETYELRRSNVKKVKETMNRLCASVSYLERLLDIKLNLIYRC